MKRIVLLCFFFHLCVNGQNSTLNNDLQIFKETILSKNKLFHSYSKNEFIKQIDFIKKDTSDSLLFWKLKALLSQFKEIDLSIHSVSRVKNIFTLKQFGNHFYLIGLPAENYLFLGTELLEINGFTIDEIKKMISAKFNFQHPNQLDKFCVDYLGNIDFLTFTGINSAKQIKIKVKDIDGVKEFIIPLKYANLVSLETTKKAFYQRFNNKPFWQYGINFGQQIFFKLTTSLTKEERLYLQDSLGLKTTKIAKLYQVPLQKVLEAKTMDYNKEKLNKKLKKKRYKQVFLDVRDFTIGTDFVFTKVLKELLKNKRFRKKNRFYIFTNKNTSNSIIPLLKFLRKETKCTIIGTSIYGSQNSITQKEIVTLPSNQYYILLPKQVKKSSLIKVDKYFETNFKQYINGVDALLQMVLQ